MSGCDRHFGYSFCTLYGLGKEQGMLCKNQWPLLWRWGREGGEGRGDSSRAVVRYIVLSLLANCSLCPEPSRCVAGRKIFA